jgi:hypothetical protein
MQTNTVRGPQGTGTNEATKTLATRYASTKRGAGFLGALLTTSLMAGCAMEGAEIGDLGEEEMVGETAQAIVRPASERETKINAKFNANTATLVSPAGGFTHFSSGSTGARRDYTGAGNNSSIYYSDNLDQARMVLGYIRGRYLATGAQAGVLGYPTSDENSTGFNTGRYNFFQSGRILWKNGAFDAFETHGGIDAAYARLGMEWGNLGFPQSNEYTSSGRQKNDFEFGKIYRVGSSTWPVLTGTNANSKLVVMNAARLTSGSISQTQLASTGCISASGAGFPPGKTVNVGAATPMNVAVRSSSTATVAANGTFSFSQVNCTDSIRSYTANGGPGKVTLYAYTTDGTASAAMLINYSAPPDPTPL